MIKQKVAILLTTNKIIKIEIKITDPTASRFNEAVGISEERSNELGAKLDQMSKRLKGQLVRTCDVFQEISSFCNNVEELIFCTVSHCNYLAINYRIFICPPKNKKQ